MEKLALGLQGVIAVETTLSDVDGERGRLILRGYALEQVAEHAGLEHAAALLVGGAFPDAGSCERWSTLLGRGRVRARELWSPTGLELPDAMSAVRAAVANVDERALGQSREECVAVLAGVIAIAATAWARKQRGLPMLDPDPTLGPADDFLRMLHGVARTPEEGKALGTYLFTVSDHGMNASTFTARVVASTGSDLVSAVTAAIGALKGPLHGGAPGPVLDMLDAILDPSGARKWLEREVSNGRRIMGLGHRIYRVRDPRALVLEQTVERLSSVLPAGSRARERLALARAVEREAESLLGELHPERALRANVEFYTAVLLEALGVPRELFSATFAAARVVGWVAHVFEEQKVGRLIRPRSRYVGPDPDAVFRAFAS
jgi:citrate synthase